MTEQAKPKYTKPTILDVRLATRHRLAAAIHGAMADHAVGFGELLARLLDMDAQWGSESAGQLRAILLGDADATIMEISDIAFALNCRASVHLSVIHEEPEW